MSFASHLYEFDKHAILAVLKNHLKPNNSVLEVGSGSGLHAVTFAKAMPNITWRTSDLLQNHALIQARIATAKLPNLFPPIVLDVSQKDWPNHRFDLVFSANTIQVLPWLHVVDMFRGVSDALVSNGLFCLYGPFNYQGKYSCDKHEQLDQVLRKDDPQSGIKDVELVTQLALKHNFSLVKDYLMPGNTHCLVWQNQWQKTDEQ